MVFFSVVLALFTAIPAVIHTQAVCQFSLTSGWRCTDGSSCCGFGCCSSTETCCGDLFCCSWDQTCCGGTCCDGFCCDDTCSSSPCSVLSAYTSTLTDTNLRVYTILIIVGGVVGGILVISVIIVVICCCVKSKGHSGNVIRPVNIPPAVVYTAASGAHPGPPGTQPAPPPGYTAPPPANTVPPPANTALPPANTAPPPSSTAPPPAYPPGMNPGYALSSGVAETSFQATGPASQATGDASFPATGPAPFPATAEPPAPVLVAPASGTHVGVTP